MNRLKGIWSLIVLFLFLLGSLILCSFNKFQQDKTEVAPINDSYAEEIVVAPSSTGWQEVELEEGVSFLRPNEFVVASYDSPMSVVFQIDYPWIDSYPERSIFEDDEAMEAYLTALVNGEAGTLSIVLDKNPESLTRVAYYDEGLEDVKRTLVGTINIQGHIGYKYQLQKAIENGNITYVQIVIPVPSGNFLTLTDHQNSPFQRDGTFNAILKSIKISQ